MSILVLCIFTDPAAHAQDHLLKERLLKSDPEEVLDMDLGTTDLLRTATRDLSSRDIREAPANLQIISARQIKASGARDLFEVLQMVPGISWGSTGNDGLAMAIHGQWAHDGNWLMLLNGEAMNDNDRGGYAIGQRIPIDNIDRIEIILGTGPPSHEEQGVLGTINVITRSSDQGSHALASFRSGYSNGSTATTMNVSGAYRLNGEQEISFLASNHRGNRSNALSLLPNGNEISFADSSGIRSSAFQLQYRWRSIKAFMYFQDEEYQVSSSPWSAHSRDVVFGLKQRTPLGKGFELSWRLKVADQTPGNRVHAPIAEIMAANTDNQRNSAMAMITYKPFTWSAIKIGAHAFDQRTRFAIRDTAARFPINDGPELRSQNIAAFAEVNVNGKFGSITGGIRSEYNTLAGSGLAPKVSYTKILGQFHGKLMHGNSFRFPSVMDLAYSNDSVPIAPANATTNEAEIGARLNGTMLITMNVYQTTFNRPNVGQVPAQVAQGVDLRVNWENIKFTAFAGFGMYITEDGASGETFFPIVHEQRWAGTPSQRAVFMIAWKATPEFTVRARGNWRSSIWSHWISDDGSIDPIDHPEEIVLHAGIAFRPKEKRFSIDLGIANLLDTRIGMIDAFDPYSAPFVLNGREYTCSLTYRLGK